MIDPEQIFHVMGPDATTPTLAHEGDAGFDLYATKEEVLLRNNTIVVNTGIRLTLPPNKFALILSRSGLAFTNRIRVFNAPGLIDNGYNGELKVMLEHCGTSNWYHVKKGQRIAQIVIMETPVYVNTNTNKRGTGGIGSSGK